MISSAIGVVSNSGGIPDTVIRGSNVVGKYSGGAKPTTSSSHDCVGSKRKFPDIINKDNPKVQSHSFF
ncbi:hypothetical protein APU01nite_02680 [Alkalibacterium putridalgicola]|uniref:Uncharacterized protein n=1 Tax=Alkalibacterium putridalgicola TaxID=426703 RepID=A0ABQ0UUL7_9LACT|nr:hypothetical protein APU01nite_02680 [Alkalibacterium putridalgicola]